MEEVIVTDFLKVDEYPSGYGDGSGYGYGDGDGYGYGIKRINGKAVYDIDGIPTMIDVVRGSYAKSRVLNDDLTTKRCYVAKCGNFFAHGDTLKDAVADARSKYESTLSEDERIELFKQAFPDYDKKIPAKDLFRWHNTLTGSCLAGRKHFCEQRGIDVEGDTYTVREFIGLTKGAYGGDIIKRLER